MEADTDISRAAELPKKRRPGVERLIAYAKRRRAQENGPSAAVIAGLCLVYFSIGLGLNMIDPEYLVAAWLFVGALGMALWIARNNRRSLLNVYTVLFGVCVVGCLAGFVLSRGWLI